MSAFALGYALLQTPSGALADRLGPPLRDPPPLLIHGVELVVHPDDSMPVALTFASAGAHRHWGFIVSGYGSQAHGANASFSAVQGFDGVTGVLGPDATAEVAALAAADATAKANAAQAAAAADATVKTDAAVAASSNNTDAIATLDTPFANDPPTLADMELMREKVNEMLLGMWR